MGAGLFSDFDTVQMAITDALWLLFTLMGTDFKLVGAMVFLPSWISLDHCIII
jgi:hypothetical protein